MEISKKDLIRKTLESTGVFRLKPTWVPRTFLAPGGRLKLHKKDLYALGTQRGGICERWIVSTTKADNGPETPLDEGLGYIFFDGKEEEYNITLKEAIDIFKSEFIGEDAYEKNKGWQVLTKFFDYKSPIHHHLHLTDESAANVGCKGKPESYYFPEQLNSCDNGFPYTFFGIIPGLTKEDVIKSLKRWYEGDNEILCLSQAYKLKIGTGWDVPAGILHAPGSLVTYEIQRSSDVFSMFQSISEGNPTPYSLLIKDVPDEHKNNFEYIADLLDWEINIDPNFYHKHFREPKNVKPIEEMKKDGYIEKWISYGSEYFSAKELTIPPQKTVTISDSEAYGLVAVQGHGEINGLTIETPTLIKYGERTADEFFIVRNAALKGVEITNNSRYENLVLLKNFQPSNIDMPK